ncbi:hypothetical protein RFI_01811 [Reticulomyxa filosa]|uniref:Nucleotide exchange factor Fes1 domain-containing protein n=1 Tax=Reticulomyxa filosa TaxID=46433 RepID=X6PB02_RETFI|nr:hypothetical protein RFI_01811 [Reticulomyxa filosa]|eukprot:ETO35249.1 hypothetical protein RFI_01811 [Reticulomyxa filosa]
MFVTKQNKTKQKSQMPPDDITQMRTILNRMGNETVEKISEENIKERDEKIANDLKMLHEMLDQVDNGENFGLMNGFELMVTYLQPNDTTDYSLEVKFNAAHAIGLACQNNQKAFAMALKAQCIPTIFQQLEQTIPKQLEQVKAADLVNYQLKLLYGLSSLIRQNPSGLQVFQQQIHGDDTIFRWLNTPEVVQSFNNRVLLKLLTLIVDITTLNDNWTEKSIFINSRFCQVLCHPSLASLVSTQYRGRELLLSYIQQILASRFNDCFHIAESGLHEIQKHINSATHSTSSDSDSEFDLLQAKIINDMLQLFKNS